MEENYSTTGFKDPFEGTPKAAIKTSYGIDNLSEVDRAKAGIIFQENGLMGMKDQEGNIIYAPQHLLIAQCVDYVFMLTPEWNYQKISEGWHESGYLREEDRPYIKDGKVGFKLDDKVIINPIYDYVTPKFGHDIFFAMKDGRYLYLDKTGKEVLTRIRWFDGEEKDYTPFWWRTDSFDYFTTIEHIGHPVDDNPNVINIYGAWVELDRHNKDEIMKMLINPDDDLALTEKSLSLLCSSFSYEYSIYFANAKGHFPLKDCMAQFEQMGAFDNSWFYVVKLWQAFGEHVSARELREFRRALSKKDQLGNLVIAVGHDEKLKSGEVRMLLITHYHERCFPPKFEFDWWDKTRKCSLVLLKDAVPELKQSIDKEIMEQYKEEVFQDLIRGIVSDLKYNAFLSWDDVEPAADYFCELGSSYELVVPIYIAKAKSMRHDVKAVSFYLHAILWAIRRNAKVNPPTEGGLPLDIIRKLSQDERLSSIASLMKEVEMSLLQNGAKTQLEIEKENDYYQELERMRINSTHK